MGAVETGRAPSVVRVDEHRCEGGIPDEHEFLRAQSASPYNITTGLDENRDGQTNERPFGFVRNSARGEPTTNVDMGLVWERSVDSRARVNAQRGGGAAAGAAVRRGGGNRAPEGILRFEIFARATNVLNLVNPQNFSGVRTSPFFGRATSAAAPRRLVSECACFSDAPLVDREDHAD